MANNVLEFLQAGFSRMEYHLLDANGVPAGATGVAPAAGATGTPAGRMYRVKTGGIKVPPSTRVAITGDDSYAGGFQFPSNAIRETDFVFAQQSLTKDGAFQNTTVTQKGNLSIGFYDVTPFNLKTALFFGVSNATAQDAGQVGNTAFVHVYGKGQAYPLGRDTWAEQAPGSNGLSVVWSAADAYPWGVTYNTSAEQITRATLDIITSINYPYTLHRWNVASGTTVLNLPYTPAGVTIGTDFFLFKRVSSSLTTEYTVGVTVNAAAKTVTIPDPAATVDILAWYPTLTL